MWQYHEVSLQAFFLHCVIQVGEVWGDGLGQRRGRSSVAQGNYLTINNYNLDNVNIQEHLVQNSEVIFCKNIILDFKLNLILMPN